MGSSKGRNINWVVKILRANIVSVLEEIKMDTGKILGANIVSRTGRNKTWIR